MELDFNVTIKNARSQVVLNAIDAGSGNGKIKFYSATKPTAGAAITDQTLIATVLFTDPCGVISSGTLTFSFDDDVLVGEGGTITWCRFTDSDDNYVLDGDVTDINGDGMIKIDFTTVYTGGTIRVLSAAFTE